MDIFKEYMYLTHTATSKGYVSQIEAISEEELRQRESSIIEELRELRQSAFYKGLYDSTFMHHCTGVLSYIRRIQSYQITYANSEGLNRLLNSLVRLRNALSSLDRAAYKKVQHKESLDAERRMVYHARVRSTIEEKVKSREKNPVPYFTSLNITKEQAEKLYEKLIPSRLEDTSKEDFVYYFTGKGRVPNKKMIWKGDAIFLSNIIDTLSPQRIPWKEMDAIFEGLNTKSMKTNLSKSRKTDTFKSNRKMIKSWLNY